MRLHQGIHVTLYSLDSNPRDLLGGEELTIKITKYNDKFCFEMVNF